MSPDARAPQRVRLASWGIPLLVAGITFVAFLPALKAGFVAWDDDKNFLQNFHYRGLGPTQLRWMWTTFHLGHWIPFSWMSLGLDYVLWGMNPAGYHLTSILLHCANAVLLYVIARRLLASVGLANTIDNTLTLTLSAAFAALFFAVHPLRVESVVWITERRDVLSGFFYFLSVYAWLRSVDDAMRRRSWYWLAVVACASALLSKTTAVTLPVALLILNVYPLRRLGGEAGWWGAKARRVYIELIPFVLLAAAATATTFVALQAVEQLPPLGKLAVSAYSLAFYVLKTILPVGLSPLYSMPLHVEPTQSVYLISVVAVVVLTVLAFSLRKKLPAAWCGWVAFVAILLPLLGLHQNGPQIAADRYTYNASAALALLGGGAFGMLRRRAPIPSVAFGGALIAILATFTWQQTLVWHDSDSLWAQVLKVEPNSAIGHNNLGLLLGRQNRSSDAMAEYLAALALAPDYADAHANLGTALAEQGNIAEAIAHFERAVASDPNFDAAHNDWGVALARTGDFAGAIQHYERALALNAENADAEVNWGNALVRLERPAEAIAHYKAALVSNPDDADAHHNWGVALARQGKFAEAIEQFRAALAIEPDHAEAREFLDRATRQLEQKSR